VNGGRARGVLRLLAWCALVGAVLIGLTRMGTGALAPPPLAHPARWLPWVATRDSVTAAVALLRLVALAGAWYLLAATVVGVAARSLGADGLVALTDRFSVPMVRRLATVAAGVTLASGVTPAVAFAHPSIRPAAAVAGPSSTATTTPTGSTPSTEPPPTMTMRVLAPDSGETPAPPAAAADAPAPRAADAWTVRPGECFWSIAEDVLRRAWNRPPTDAEIVPYWRVLIEANRARLGDPRNPDLIFPAQVFTVPAPPPG
jgi:hypothetical protein